MRPAPARRASRRGRLAQAHEVQDHKGPVGEVAADTTSMAHQAGLGRRREVSLSLAGRMKLLFLIP